MELILLLLLASPLVLIVGVVLLFRRKDATAWLMTGFGGLGTTVLAWLIYDLSKMPSKGRLLRLGGRTRQARVRSGDGWLDQEARSVGEGLTAWERTAVGAAWLSAASLEHASVAAFSRLSDRLMMLGAPAGLIERCHLAALDEIKHARLTFSLASAFSGNQLGAGEFPALGEARPARVASRSSELCRLATASLIDGALGEGVAAEVASHGCHNASDQRVRDVLEVIARDEARHAELAWDTIAWCLDEGGTAVRAALKAAIPGLAERATPELPPLPGIDQARVAGAGFVGQADLGAITFAVIADVQSRAARMLGAAPADERRQQLTGAA